MSFLSCVQLFATPWTVTHQVPLPMGFSRQEYRSGLPCPSPGDLPDSGIKPLSLTTPALASGFFTTRATWEAQMRDSYLKEQVLKRTPLKEYRGSICFHTVFGFQNPITKARLRLWNIIFRTIRHNRAR